ncbi:hyccin 2-like [Brevipalpus obovatus]|uniref:hyccin 2-like n=1 Tax=Brevipalpus obovatus TaxID=246614 RepID=UPI003D9E3994
MMIMDDVKDEDVDMVKRWIDGFVDEINSNDGVEDGNDGEKSFLSINLANAIIKILEDNRYHDEFLVPVCDRLFQLYRDNKGKPRLFILTFIPSLIGLHLNRCIKPMEVRRRSHCVDTLLLAIYNIEIANEDGMGNNKSFRVPQLIKPSIYHELPTTNSIPSNQTTLNTDFNFLRVDPRVGFTLIPVHPITRQQDYINASNRIAIMTSLLIFIHENLSLLKKNALAAIPRMTLSILESKTCRNEISENNGKEIPENGDSNHLTEVFMPKPRKIPLSSDFLVQLLSCVYFCLYNGFTEESLAAIEMIHRRGKYELYTDIILMCNAISNSTKFATSRNQNMDNSGLSLDIPPQAPVATTNTKAAITNASFKTQKLPEDIPIVTSSTSFRMQPISES